MRTTWIQKLSHEEALALQYRWDFWARTDQLPPARRFLTWLLLGGRGSGKTRAAVEWVHNLAESGKIGGGRIAICGRTAKDVREVMVEGESGLLARNRPWFQARYQAGLSRIVWPNGVLGLLYTADEPDSFAGHQHGAYWCDEMALWRYPQAFTQLKLGLRLGNAPQGVVSTTPRPKKHIRDLIARSSTAVTRATTYANLINLAPTFREEILSEYEGTRLGDQELLGLLLDDNPNGLWKRDLIEAHRVTQAPDMRRIVVGVDPAATSHQKSNNTGIVVVGLGADGRYYVLEDGTCHDKPHIWGAHAISLYHKYKCDRLIGESNCGGEMVEGIIKILDPTVAYKAVHATRSKRTRAEPIAALYEQGRVKHVGLMEHLEDEMCVFDPLADATSPDRMDALVWAIWELHNHTKPSYRGLRLDVSPTRINPLRGI